jgi:hypothetical protein
MRYCPVRWDFSVRYLDRDLPADVYNRFKTLVFATELEDLQRKWEAAADWGTALLGDVTDSPIQRGTPSGDHL